MKNFLPSRASLLAFALALGVFGCAMKANAATAGAERHGAAATTASEIIAIEFSPGNALQTVVDVIDSADKELVMAAYSFTSKPVAEALVKAKKRGVSVKVVLDKSQESEKYTVATFLKNQEVPFVINRKYAIMHNKFIVVDGQIVQTGSFNYTSSASNRNAENVIVVRNRDAALKYKKEFQRLWVEAKSDE
jgi:phosphatidylserine/phosphatidylglycerophosphate/cardiolipin synthase-like enzyme